MKRLLLSFLAGIFAVVITAQPSARQELRKDVKCSASNCRVYPEPAQRKLTPAPKGKRPFYMSHYGRHGSRYLINTRDYRYVLDMLEKAESRGKLSELGRDVLGRIKRMDADAQDKLGELTELGVSQERGIARRMAENFPELFKGDAVVNAHSTMVLRCVFSMENALHELLSMNPRLQVTHEATRRDMHLLSYIDRDLNAKTNSTELRAIYDEFCRRNSCWERVARSLFNDTTYLREMANGERLNYYLFRMAGSVQNTELSSVLTLYDLFTPDEIYQNWKMENVYWFLGYGKTDLNGGRQPYSQRYLLRQMISDADSCILLDRPGVMLRYGHETSLLPLVCLMDINHYGQTFNNLDQLAEKGWVNYRIFPMGANIQMVFYRRDQKDQDVLVKLLLNEQEATLPVKTDVAPYYHWKDVRDFYLKMLDRYEQNQ